MKKRVGWVNAIVSRLRVEATDENMLSTVCAFDDIRCPTYIARSLGFLNKDMTLDWISLTWGFQKALKRQVPVTFGGSKTERR